MRKPTATELEQSKNTTVPDVVAPQLRILFCGINPGLYTAAVGHHFARPGNRFWLALYDAGLTPRLLAPDEEQELLAWGMGITNIVPRATATAAEVTPTELAAGGESLVAKIRLYRPRALAVLGISAYRTAFHHPTATLGRQDLTIGDTGLWALPNPSGLNAHYRLKDLAAWYQRLREEVEGMDTA